MELVETFVFIATIIQSLETGTFLVLDLANKDLQTKWGFSQDDMIKIGTIGYSLGFLITACYSLFITKISPKITILIGGSINILCWLSIYISLCQGCVNWPLSMLFEAGICTGTSLLYLNSSSIITKSNSGQKRKVKLIILALFVAVGSIIAFLIFVDLNNTRLVILVMLLFSCLSTFLLFIASFLYKEEIIINLPGNRPVEKSFSGSFFIYLFSLNLTFGVIMTFINSANGILDSFEKKVSKNDQTQLPLICFVIGNLVGRSSGIFLRNYLQYILFLFAGFSIIISIFTSTLLIFWKIEFVFLILITSSLFFGIVWTISMPLAGSFFNIREDRSLGYIFFGMSFFPCLFGLLESWLYHYKHSHGEKCDNNCYWTYLCLSSMACFLAFFTYLISWYMRGNERLKGAEENIM